ncbi:alpha/beta hydrolase [Salinisphaera sp. Q1T1-3]|uniref:alpha/beta hydrolase n=1 Tax=Salinisphaera sp. Q1T1-3 TaxID=2321229 RepID=UPI000E767094|nr:alpha/beta fold hydrolase [Salinisphaera sp. Q1T1-3]RJS94665.1 alpha/beta hydrolase [Salinisphaera sp. Q1T1-3]
MTDLTWPTGTDKRASGFIDGPDGRLEVDVELPGDPPRGVVVVCHPHPQQGGTKDNKVVYMTARAARESGFATLRFNFRATGASEGRYDEGRGEQDDLRAVRDWALAASGLSLAGLAGFSFGSAVALRVAAADGAPSLLTIGLPSAYFDNELPRPDCHWLAVFGDADDVIDVETAIKTVRALDPAPALVILEDAGHFLHGRLSELRRHAQTFWQAEC